MIDENNVKKVYDEDNMLYIHYYYICECTCICLINLCFYFYFNKILFLLKKLIFKNIIKFIIKKGCNFFAFLKNFQLI